jgi:hypothetical protein
MAEIGKFIVENYVYIFAAISALIAAFVSISRITKTPKDDIIADKAQSFWAKFVAFFSKK